MRFLRNVVIGLVGLVAILAIVGMLLPRNVIVERDLVIDAPAEEIFPHMASLQAFAEWSPWRHYDPEMVVTFSGPDAGVGNVMEWTSEHPNVGNGRQEIVEIVENESIRTRLSFDDMADSSAWWSLAPEGDGTRVTWGLDADMGAGPIGRWFGLFMDGLVGADYETGLTELSGIVGS